MVNVVLSRKAQKSLCKAPNQVVNKLDRWIIDVMLRGIETVKLVPGWHDKPLSGQRQGQRSIRLNIQWRAIYQETDNGITIHVMEVTPHDYRSQ